MAEAEQETPEKSKKPAPQKRSRKEVPGNFSYTTTPGRFKDVLKAMIEAERPPAFNRDFIETVLDIRGGVVTAFPPILKRIGFLNSDNSPTDLYGQFQGESSRSYAALEGLKNGFGELFKRNAHADKADDEKIKDYLVQITGRKRDDQVISAILGTFNAIRSFIKGEVAKPEGGTASGDKDLKSSVGHDEDPKVGNLGLAYHINIVLPETKDVAVFNAIFQSLRQNLLK